MALLLLVGVLLRTDTAAPSALLLLNPALCHLTDGPCLLCSTPVGSSAPAQLHTPHCVHEPPPGLVVQPLDLHPLVHSLMTTTLPALLLLLLALVLVQSSLLGRLVLLLGQGHQVEPDSVALSLASLSCIARVIALGTWLHALASSQSCLGPAIATTSTAAPASSTTGPACTLHGSSPDPDLLGCPELCSGLGRRLPALARRPSTLALTPHLASCCLNLLLFLGQSVGLNQGV